MSTHDAQQKLAAAFPEFYNHPVIQDLGHEPRWTVSDSDKAPIDMRELIDADRLRGAWARDERCLVTLDELTGFLPNAANNAFYLQSRIDGYAVLDIEPACPPEIAASLLEVEAEYAEYSMSGRGYHLLLPLPGNFADYPIAANKRVLRHHTGWFEVLLEHWVTFTRKPVATMPAPNPGTWEKVYATLASAAKETVAAEVDIDAEKPEIPFEDKILQMIIDGTRLKKTLEDFNNDYSRYEFSVMGSIYNTMSLMTWAFSQDGTTHYDDTAKAWLVFLAAQKILDPRDKHHERRNGMPLLLNNSVSLIAQRKGQAQQHL